MTIDGNFYRNDIRTVLKQGPLKVSQIKSKLDARNIKLDETQILDALNAMIRSRIVVRTDGKFGLVTFS
jgi:predicted transcriptional regulator